MYTFITYSSHIHHSINNFQRNKSIRMLTSLLIPLDTKLHQVATNLGKKKVYEKKMLLWYCKRDRRWKNRWLEWCTEEHLIENRSPTYKLEFPLKNFPDKSKKDGVVKRYCKLSWFTDRLNFIAYSRKKDDRFYLPCLLVPTEAKHSACANLLLNKAYESWKDIQAGLKNIRSDNIIKHRWTKVIYLSLGTMILIKE